MMMNAGQASLILIVGFPRSGTTLLRRVLGRHSKVAVVDHEPHYAFRLFKRYGQFPENTRKVVESLQKDPSFPDQKVGTEDLYPGSGARTADVLRRAFYLLAEHASTAQFIAVKLPRIIYRLEAWQGMFPEGRVIHIARDPRGTVASNLARWPSMNAWECITRWKRAIRAGKRWGRSNPGLYQETKFENILRRPQAEMKSVCTFIGVDYEPEMLNISYTLAQWSLSNPGAREARRFSTFDTSKIDEWRRSLSDFIIQLVESRCAGEMEKLGYEKASLSVNLLGFGVYVSWYWSRHILSRAARKIGVVSTLSRVKRLLLD